MNDAKDETEQVFHSVWSIQAASEYAPSIHSYMDEISIAKQK